MHQWVLSRRVSTRCQYFAAPQMRPWKKGNEDGGGMQLVQLWRRTVARRYMKGVNGLSRRINNKTTFWALVEDLGATRQPFGKWGEGCLPLGNGLAGFMRVNGGMAEGDADPIGCCEGEVGLYFQGLLAQYRVCSTVIISKCLEEKLPALLPIMEPSLEMPWSWTGVWERKRMMMRGKVCWRS